MDYIKLGIKILDKVVKVIKKELIDNNDKEKKETNEKDISGDSHPRD